MDHQLDDYRQLIRDFHPKRSNIHKIHRWRDTITTDGVIAKVPLVEAFPWTDFSEATCNKTLNKLDEDWTGLKTGVLYSLKKQKRWELPLTLEANLPKYDSYKMPLDIGSVSLTRFHRHNTHCCSPVYWFYNNVTGYSLNSSGDNVKGFKLESSDGKIFSKKKMAKSNIRQVLKTKGEVDYNYPPKIHLQFQTVEFKSIPNHHNSRIYDYHPSWDNPWKGTAVRLHEPYLVGKEVPSTGYLSEDIVYSDSRNDADIDLPADKPRSLTLGDFVDVHNISKKIRGKKSNLREWVIV